MGNNNGILDLETINNELMEQRNIDTKPAGSEVLNTETVMNSETMNPFVSALAALEPVNTAMPAPVAIEPVNPVVPNPTVLEPVNQAMPASVNQAMPAPVAIEPVNPVVPNPTAQEPINPVVPDFKDLEMQDNIQNFEQPIMPETIDSRSFTHTAADWKRIQEEETNRVDFAEVSDSANLRDNYGADKTQIFFQVFFAFLVSIIIAVVFMLINVKFYNIEYISTLQFLMSMLPAVGLFYGFYYMTGKRKMTAPVAILLIVVNEFISYFMFHAVMVHGVREMYAELSYREAREFVKIMKTVTETKGFYYEHFAAIFGVSSLAGIVFGWYGIRGMLDAKARRRRRH